MYMRVTCSLIAVGKWKLVKIVYCGENGYDSIIHIIEYSSNNLLFECLRIALVTKSVRYVRNPYLFDAGNVVMRSFIEAKHR
jgi:hypothetical protein